MARAERTWKNQCLLDRTVRFLLGALFVFVGYLWALGSLQAFFYLASAAMALTSVTGFCPLYRFLNYNTLEVE